MVHILEIQQFQNFLETLPGNFFTIRYCSEISGIFGRIESDKVDKGKRSALCHLNEDTTCF